MDYDTEYVIEAELTESRDSMHESCTPFDASTSIKFTHYINSIR